MAVKKKKKSVPVKINKVKSETRTKKNNVIAAIGRRKSAVARVRLTRGGNGITVNGKESTQYFQSIDSQGVFVNEPLKVVGVEGKVTITAKVVGSGLKAQLSAVVFGVSRALVLLDESYKKSLRAVGLLTRDPRMKESRKIGLGGKARRKKQSPKR